MTRDEAVTQITDILGFNSSSTVVTKAQNALMFVQNELEHDAELPYFLKEEVTNLTCTASNERMATPAGFIRIWDEDALYVQELNSDPVTWVPLDKDEPRYLRVNTQEDGEAQPTSYAWPGQSEFMLFPTPDQVYTFRLIYYKADAVLSSNITNKGLTHLPYLMIGKAGVILAASLRDQGALSIFTTFIQNELPKLNSLTTDRDQSGRKLVVGGPD